MKRKSSAKPSSKPTRPSRTYDIQPCPTPWNGTTFRSRLEARWAVFFYLLRVEYVYEPQFDVPGLFYIPDFWLPYHNCIVEIKPNRATPEEMDKARRLAVQACIGVSLKTPVISRGRTFAPSQSFTPWVVLMQGLQLGRRYVFLLKERHDEQKYGVCPFLPGPDHLSSSPSPISAKNALQIARYYDFG